MSKKIWKFTFDDGSTEATFDYGASGCVLHVGEQREKIAVWIQVDPAEKSIAHEFLLVATGQDVPEKSAYMGSTVFTAADEVWHLFKVFS